MQGTMSGALTPYVTSSFQEHSLTATTGIMSSLISGLSVLPLAKALDIWGRPNGFLVMIGFSTAGLIMMAACQNVATYAAAQVLYGIGYAYSFCRWISQLTIPSNTGFNFCLSIFIADTSQLKNRALMFGFVSSPYIITVWCGGPAAESFLKNGGFRWGFGTFAIVVPAMSLPLYALFTWNYRKAKKAGLTPEEKSSRSFHEALKFYFIEFDIIGLFLIAGGLALFLLPFSLYSYQKEQWRSPMIIAMIVVGICMIIAFGFYERFVAPKKYMPYELFGDRTVVGACILAAILFIEFYIWDSYFSSFLQVVNNLNVTQSSYVVNIYSIGSCFWALVVGALIRYTGRFKWIALYFGVPVTILGVGLMLKFRQPDSPLGYIIMCQIFIAFGGGALVICEQIAAMAATTQQYVAVVLAIEGVFANVGGAIGSTIAAAIWTATFPTKLATYLPAESQADFASIYGDLSVQLSYERGSATRIAIETAYGDAQKNMLIAATAVTVVAIAAVAIWRDIKVKDFRQVTGNVV